MKKSYLIVRILRKIVLSLFLNTDIIILQVEANLIMLKRYPKFNDKFICHPFCLDLDFWKPKKEINNHDKEGISLLAAMDIEILIW